MVDVADLHHGRGKYYKKSVKYRVMLYAFYIVLAGFLQNHPELSAESYFTSSNPQKPITPLTEYPLVDAQKSFLGEQLFHDTALSKDRRLSCNSCHNLNEGGDDNQQFSFDTRGQPRTVNTPTVFNATLNDIVGLTGKFDSQKDFFTYGLFAEAAMNKSLQAIAEDLEKQQNYRTLFSQSYSDGITPENIVDALMTFQKTLVTPNSAFDRYLSGDNQALSKKEIKGFRLFQSYGCIACHQGKNIGGNMYQRFGIFEDYYQNAGLKPVASDYGRLNVTNVERDKFYFRVPSLRNVAMTAPYLHDGSVETLDEAISVMARYQLGRDIPKSDRENIEAFLHTLTGSYKNNYVKEH